MPGQSRRFDTSMLLAWLAAQQRRVLGILDGLTSRLYAGPSCHQGGPCAGMVQHLTMMMSFWFAEVMNG